MDKVITLICNPNERLLGDGLIDRVGRYLGDCRRSVLAEGVATDFHCTGAPDANGLRRIISQESGGARVDIVVQPAEGRRKKLLIADMDSTIIEQECIDEIADFAGKRAEISAITERAMRGELDFEAALLERLAMLKGLPVAILDEVFAKQISLTPGARTLVRTMQKLGATTALVSGGFTYFTERVAAAAGFEIHEANELVASGGKLSGDVVRPVRGREAKEEALQRIAAERGVPLAQTMAVGDGANDLKMLARAGLGVAFHAKPAVAAAADARIDFGDLTALLYIQGIQQAEFAA